MKDQVHGPDPISRNESDSITMSKSAKRATVIGAGLWGQVLSLFLSDHGYIVDLFEIKPQFDMEKTWSFHGSDVPESLLPFVENLSSYHWQKQSVQFHQYSRTIETPYFTIRSSDLAKKVMGNSKIEIHFGTQFKNDSLNEEIGGKSDLPLIIDTAGQPFKLNASEFAYQKFVGLEFLLENKHGVDYPVIMDATVPQLDGYRFMYLLPFGEKTIFVEDTRYSKTPFILEADYKQEIASYVKQKGWIVKDVIYTEKSALPIPFNVPVSEETRMTLGKNNEVISLGVAQGLYHPVTGYSSPLMWKTLDVLKIHLNRGSQGDRNSDQWLVELKLALGALREDFRQGQRVYCFLNRLMFLASSDEKRFVIFERFYKFSRELIERFYSMDNSYLDWAKIFSGRPPVSVSRAMVVLKDFVLRSPM